MTHLRFFKTKKESEKYLIKLYDVHYSLNFTSEEEIKKSLPFFDVYVEPTKTGYGGFPPNPPTFSSQYVRWKVFYID